MDQSRPYVLVGVRLSPISFDLLDLVIGRLAGAQPAYDVTVRVDPAFFDGQGKMKKVTRIARCPRPASNLFPCLPLGLRLRSHTRFHNRDVMASKMSNLADADNVTNSMPRRQEAFAGRKLTETLDMDVPEGTVVRDRSCGLRDKAKALHKDPGPS